MQAPELQLSEPEAKAYAEAIRAVARHYDIGASAKALDIFNLCTTMGSIYGIRLMAITARKKGYGQAEPEPEAAPAPGIDMSMRPQTTH